MDRLTRGEIEQWREWGLKGYPIEFRQVLSPKFCQLCDLALQSLSQEAVREEVLEAIQRIKSNWELLARGKSVHLSHVTEGFAQELESGIEDAISILKREPNSLDKKEKV